MVNTHIPLHTVQMQFILVVYCPVPTICSTTNRILSDPVESAAILRGDRLPLPPGSVRRRHRVQVCRERRAPADGVLPRAQTHLQQGVCERI